jgi:hypothetical protein
MKRISLLFALALPALTAIGCSVEDADVQPTTQTAQALSGFTFDTSGLSITPPRTLPTGLLPATAFNDEVIIRSLIQTTESFTSGLRAGSLTEKVSANWKFEKDQTQGAILVLKTTPSGKPSTQDETSLQRLALSRAYSFGISGSEIGRVLQRRALLQDQDDTGLATPEVHRYKTFLFRAINRIPVEGHRLVISHAGDGSFVRAFLKWPAVASSGHLLTTALTVADIQERAVRALNAEGETRGNVNLSWKYVPTALPGGEVTLTLKVSARLLASAVTQENREIDVDVDAR